MGVSCQTKLIVNIKNFCGLAFKVLHVRVIYAFPSDARQESLCLIKLSETTAITTQGIAANSSQMLMKKGLVRRPCLGFALFQLFIQLLKELMELKLCILVVLLAHLAKNCVQAANILIVGLTRAISRSKSGALFLESKVVPGKVCGVCRRGYIPLRGIWKGDLLPTKLHYLKLIACAFPRIDHIQIAEIFQNGWSTGKLLQ